MSPKPVCIRRVGLYTHTVGQGGPRAGARPELHFCLHLQNMPMACATDSPLCAPHPSHRLRAWPRTPGRSPGSHCGWRSSWARAALERCGWVSPCPYPLRGEHSPLGGTLVFPPENQADVHPVWQLKAPSSPFPLLPRVSFTLLSSRPYFKYEAPQVVAGTQMDYGLFRPLQRGWALRLSNDLPGGLGQVASL